MKQLLSALVITLSFFTSHCALANELTIKDAYVRATPPHAQNSAAFMIIKNSTSEKQKLISAKSDIAARVELHNHILQDGLMKMRQVDQITIEAGAEQALQPGSYHIMFIGLKQPLVDGESVQLQLHFDNGEAITINAQIKKITMNNNKTH